MKLLPCGSPRDQYINSVSVSSWPQCSMLPSCWNASCDYVGHDPGNCYNMVNRQNLRSHKIAFDYTFFSAIQLFWNFSQSMAVILPCSVQNFKTIWALNVYYDRDFVRIKFRRVLDGFLILQWTHFLQWSAGQVWIDYYTVLWLWNSQGMRHALLSHWNTYRSSALYGSCNAFLAHVTSGNSPHFPGGTRGRMVSCTTLTVSLPTVLCKETVKQSLSCEPTPDGSRVGSGHWPHSR